MVCCVDSARACRRQVKTGWQSGTFKLPWLGSKVLRTNCRQCSKKAEGIEELQATGGVHDIDNEMFQYGSKLFKGSEGFPTMI